MSFRSDFYFDFIKIAYDVFCVLLLAAMLFGGKIKVNPAHPKHIGSIDPKCNVVDVVKGKFRET